MAGVEAELSSLTAAYAPDVDSKNNAAVAEMSHAGSMRRFSFLRRRPGRTASRVPAAAGRTARPASFWTPHSAGLARLLTRWRTSALGSRSVLASRLSRLVVARLSFRACRAGPPPGPPVLAASRPPGADRRRRECDARFGWVPPGGLTRRRRPSARPRRVRRRVMQCSRRGRKRLRASSGQCSCRCFSMSPFPILTNVLYL